MAKKKQREKDAVAKSAAESGTDKDGRRPLKHGEWNPWNAPQREERKRNVAELDRQAARFSDLWTRFRRQCPSADLADFARQFDQTVPVEFDDCWDHPAYQKTAYLLARAGLRPELRRRRKI